MTHFCTDLKERGFSYSGRRKYSEVERVTEKNEKREHGKWEGALGRVRVREGELEEFLDAGKTTSTSFSEHVAEWTCLFMLGV